jgi:hypothetical protein
MNEVYWNLLLFIVILLGAYFLLRNFNVTNNRVGLDTMDERRNANSDSTSGSNGIASNSQTYSTQIKELNTKMKDILNVSNSEYRKNYEDIILNIDDLINNIMLKTTLSIDKDKPEEGIIKLSQLNQARSALNNVLKFVDKQ